jgi:hypothetical protein
MRSPIAFCIAALSLLACSDSEGGGSGGGASSTATAASSGGDDSTSAESGGGGDASSSESASGSGGAGGGGTESALVLNAWQRFQGRFATGTAGDEAPAKVAVGCAVDLPEIGSRAVYVEHGEPGAAPDGQFVLVTEETSHAIYLAGIARIHRVDPAAWAGRCDGEPIIAPGAVELEPACELNVADPNGDGGRTETLLNGSAPAGTFDENASSVSVIASGTGIDWRVEPESGADEEHDLERLTPLPELPGSD